MTNIIVMIAMIDMLTIYDCYDCYDRSALDVFVIAVAASMLEIQQFAAFIVGDRCDGINMYLAMYLDKPLDGDDVCFNVIATFTDVSNLI